MRNRLSATLLSATLLSATLLSAAPVPAAAADAGASAHLIRYKIVFGRCKDTCRIKVQITNISRKTLYDVSLTARLKVNKTKVGSCHDYVGTIRAKRERWAGCTVRSAKLTSMWKRWLDGEIRWDTRAGTVVHYEYYR
ncbi:hypothetical protein ACIBG4_12285 [Nonomuraea sp. NPDC050383]|uniref:hypothetical protein n=1 Tax=Nonomuraea sp. NPDC050383 TaxID=3364362 RepID=UPI0037AD2E90